MPNSSQGCRSLVNLASVHFGLGGRNERLMNRCPSDRDSDSNNPKNDA